ncbi:hypothetical protein [Streptomyces sp. 8L]|uniref:hypothetical protein n=1 Tax=Streptomyces sp. 8L TaxID=2877242 RepID=UPI001CD6BCE5|nr:hypothetical protein [Streptomyces sp. 8L]MCA1220687.1 hypothetical protein [Streptomyces sp. 8L]
MMASALSVPPLEALTEEQRRGGACVYCGLPVPTGTAVDLGARRQADGTRIFPRAHPACLPGGAS